MKGYHPSRRTNIVKKSSEELPDRNKLLNFMFATMSIVMRGRADLMESMTLSDFIFTLF